MPIFLIIGAMFSISPVIYAFSPIKGNLIFFFMAFCILLIKNSLFKTSKFTWLVFGVFLSTTFLSALYWQQPKILFLSAYFLSSIIIVYSLSEDNIIHFVDFSTKLLLVTIIGAIVGTVYALMGGQPIFDFSNPDGRLCQFYITTLTNFQVGNFIRPSGFFDEPGALSFFICFIAACRHEIGASKVPTWALLILGFISTSIAHLLYVMFHLLQEVKDKKRFIKILLLFFSILILMAMLIKFYEPLQSVSLFFTNRIMNGDIGADRLDTFKTSFGYLDLNSFFYGVNGDCAVRLVDCTNIGYSVVDANPLTPIVEWGILLAWPFYISLIYLFLVSVFRVNLITFGLLLLLLQRPYTMNVGYSLLIMITLFIVYYQHRFDRKL